MKRIKPLFYFTAMMLLLNSFIINAQDESIEKKSESDFDFSFNADLVSRYIWRGLLSSPGPNIQPYASISYKNISFGAWGSYSLTDPYAETDLYLSYTAGPVSFTINDYYSVDETDLTTADYFDYSDETPHLLEGAICFEGTDKIPFSLTVATMFYGADKDTVGDNNFSTYLEAAYEFNIKENTLSIFAGGTVSEGYYADKAAFINFGLTVTREIKISDTFSLPLSISLINNPNDRDIFFVFGMTF